MVSINVTKRNGQKETLNIDKIHEQLELVSKGLKNVSISQIELNANLQFYDGIKTSFIQNILIQSAANLITLDTPDYQFIASRLLVNDVRKKVWKDYKPSNSLYERFRERVKNKIYDDILIYHFSDSDYKAIEAMIDYDIIDSYTYAGVRQLTDKYILKNRLSESEYYETIEEAQIAIAMISFYNVPDKLKRIKEFYDLLKTNIISLPTPIYSGVRTTMKQYASCCLIEMGDDINSILSTNYAIGRYTALRSGIGVNMGKIRGINASIRNGEVVHTGQIPLLKTVEANTLAYVQNGIRGGSTAVFYPWWHWEIESIIELRNNTGTHESRVRELSYNIGLNKLFLDRAKNNENITLFSSEEVPLLFEEGYTTDYDKFKIIYERYEHKRSIRKKVINARQLLIKILKERFETGYLFLHYIDNMNRSPFLSAIRQSNLCSEVLIPTKPINLVDVNQGWIAMCILSCVNIGHVKSDEELASACDMIVRFLNQLIDYQEYPFNASEENTKGFRSLGIGISDYFHWLAINHMKYDDPKAITKTFELAEKFQYYLLQASCKLAQETEPAPFFNETKYSEGWLPIDDLPEENKRQTQMNWEQLRKDIRQYGLKNCVVSAIPPTASSSSVSNSTPGVEPPKKPITRMSSKQGVFPQLVKDWNKLKSFYTFQDEVKNEHYFKLIAQFQMFIDQSISTNEYFMWSNNDNPVKIGDIIKDIYQAHSLGLKTLYYMRTPSASAESTDAMSEHGVQDEGCSSGACAI